MECQEVFANWCPRKFPGPVLSLQEQPDNNAWNGCFLASCCCTRAYNPPVPMICEPLCAHQHLSVWSSHFFPPWVWHHGNIDTFTLIPRLTWMWWRPPYFQQASSLSDHLQYQQVLAQTPDIWRLMLQYLWLLGSDVDKDLLSMVGLTMAFALRTRILIPCSLALATPDEKMMRQCFTIFMPSHLQVLLIMKGPVDTVSIPVPLQLGHLKRNFISKSDCLIIFLSICQSQRFICFAQKSWPLRFWSLFTSTPLTAATCVHNTHIHVFCHLKNPHISRVTAKLVIPPWQPAGSSVWHDTLLAQSQTAPHHLQSER